MYETKPFYFIRIGTGGLISLSPSKLYTPTSIEINDIHGALLYNFSHTTRMPTAISAGLPLSAPAVFQWAAGFLL